MLSRASRLRAAEVRHVLGNGRGVRGEYLSLKYVPGRAFRGAAVVSKKLAKTAPLRNSIRRAVYTAMRTTSLPKIDAVGIVHTVPPKPRTRAFTKDLERLCSKLSS